MQDEIERDLKTALLARDHETTELLKGLKSALQYEAVAKKIKKEDLSEEQVQSVLAREAKKRQDTAEIYAKAGEAERAKKELTEKELIAKYLPEQLSDEAVAAIVQEEVAKLDAPSAQDMGRIIGAVRGRTGAAADGGLIARLVKEQLDKS